MNSEIEKNENNNLPIGKYTLVAFDIDTTGRRLIDEIVQLAAYTPEKQFSQYIMPYMNLNPAARQRHQVRVITVGFYRMLKCMQTFKVVKSKSEVAALKDFLDWIEDVKKSDENSLGVILVHHEERKFAPYVLLEALKKYSMLDRFFNTVKSFTNGYPLAKEKCVSNVKNFSLRQLSRLLLNNGSNDDYKDNNNKDNFEGNARVRARLAYQIVYRIAKDDLLQQQQQQQQQSQQQQQQPNIESNKIIENMIKLILKYTNRIENDIIELGIQNKIVERQNSFRPVFLQYFKTTLYHRVKAVKFRIILAEKGYDYETLKNIWNEKKKDGLTEIIKTIDTLKNDEKNELIQILDCYFDPIKQPIKPVVRRSRRRRMRNNNNGNGNGGSGGGGGGNNRNKENVSPSRGGGDGNQTDGGISMNNRNDPKFRSSSVARRRKMGGRRSRNRFSRNPLSSNL